MADDYVEAWGQKPMIASDLEAGLPKPPKGCFWLIVRGVEAREVKGERVLDKKLEVILFRRNGEEFERVNYRRIDVGLYGECAREAARNIMENLNG